MEGDIKKYQEHGCENCQRNPHKMGDMEFDDSKFDDSELPSRISNISERTVDSEQNVRRNGSKLEESFGLEMPSPMTPGTISSTITNADPEKDSFLLPKPSPYGDSTVDSAKKKLRFSVPIETSDEYLPKKQLPNCNRITSSTEHASQYSHPGTVSSRGSSTGVPQAGPSQGMFNIQVPPMARAPGNLNISITPEMEDCLRLMDQAEKRCKDNSPPQQTTASTLTFARHGSFGQDSLSSYSRGLIAANDKKPNPAAATSTSNPAGLGGSLPSMVHNAEATQGLSTLGASSMFASAPFANAGPHGTGVGLGMEPSYRSMTTHSLSQPTLSNPMEEPHKHPPGPMFRP